MQLEPLVPRNNEPPLWAQGLTNNPHPPTGSALPTCGLQLIGARHGHVVAGLKAEEADGGPVDSLRLWCEHCADEHS